MNCRGNCLTSLGGKNGTENYQRPMCHVNQIAVKHTEQSAISDWSMAPGNRTKFVSVIRPWEAACFSAQTYLQNVTTHWLRTNDMCQSQKMHTVHGPLFICCSLCWKSLSFPHTAVHLQERSHTAHQNINILRHNKSILKTTSQEQFITRQAYNLPALP